MQKKHIYWISLASIFIIVIITIAILPDHDLPLLYIENSLSEQTTLSINDIYTLKGIDFANLRSSYEEINDNVVQNTISVLETFYQQYKDEKGNTLIKVFYIDQIIQKCDLRDFTYSKLIFTSANGESITIQPTEYDDYLVLLTLEKKGQQFVLRLVLPLDNSQNRWINNIIKITML